jgi:Uma2 family endonuclease
MPVPASSKLTYDDLVALPEDGMRHELIDGEHYVTPSPRSVHQLIAGNLYYLLRDHLKSHPLGVVMIAPYDIVFSRFDVVVPDLVYFTRQRFEEVVNEKNAQGPPNLVVEVLSPRTRRRDELIKRRLYERVGVEDYWVVDPEIDTVRVYRATSGTYGRATEFALDRGDALTSPLFPELSLGLADVFAPA